MGWALPRPGNSGEPVREPFHDQAITLTLARRPSLSRSTAEAHAPLRYPPDSVTLRVSSPHDWNSAMRWLFVPKNRMAASGGRLSRLYSDRAIRGLIVLCAHFSEH